MNDNFYDDWRYLMSEYDLPTGNELSRHGFTSLNELNDVVMNAMYGNKENGLLRINNVRNYLKDVLTYEENNSGAYTDDNYDEYEENLKLLNQLIEDLEPSNFKEIMELVTPEEEILVGRLTDKPGLGPDVKQEILEYVGMPIKGGRKRNSKRRKSKSSTKRRTKRRKYKAGRRKTKKRY